MDILEIKFYYSNSLIRIVPIIALIIKVVESNGSGKIHGNLIIAGNVCPFFKRSLQLFPETKRNDCFSV